MPFRKAPVIQSYDQKCINAYRVPRNLLHIGRARSCNCFAMVRVCCSMVKDCCSMVRDSYAYAYDCFAIQTQSIDAGQSSSYDLAITNLVADGRSQALNMFKSICELCQLSPIAAEYCAIICDCTHDKLRFANSSLS